MFKKFCYLSGVLLIVLTLMLSGCGSSAKSTVKSNPRPPARTGNMTTGAKVDAVTQSINASGGIIAVSKQGDTLDGFVIDVPPNSYSGNNNFKISYAPITGQTFGSDINPISPMITVDNGGTVSNELMYVRVPVTVPAGYFAMGFIYDATTKQLEGMPLIAADAVSVTVGTTHFCDMFISMIDKALLKTDIDSGFLPGVDDWQFTNYGSYIAPGGHCEGQSMSALWYYCTHPDGNDVRLYGQYDNNGDQPTTPAFWEDDSMGYRLASVVQTDINGLSTANKFWLNLGGKNWVLENNKWKLVDVPAGLSDEMTWNLFAYSIQATKEPQLVVIWSQAGGGHAMICYRINDGNLYIADPNYPGNPERRILYANGKFQAYNSGANADEIAKGNGTAYNNIQYYAKSTVLPWAKIAQRWTEFKNNTIGSTKFPAYSLLYMDDKGEWDFLSDGLKTQFDAIAISSSSTTNGISTAVYVYKDGALLSYDAKGNFDLQPGDNKLGIEIVGKAGNDWKYIDFKYITVTYDAETTTTKTTVKNSHPVITSFTGPTDVSQLKDPNGTVQFSIKISGGKAPYKENWSANLQTIFDGKNLETVNVPVSRLRWNGDSWSIYLTVEDANGEQAEWIDSVGMAHSEFVYDFVQNGQIILEPTIPYHAFGAN